MSWWNPIDDIGWLGQNAGNFANGAWDVLRDAGMGAGAGAGAGSVVPGVGTVVGGIAGAGAGLLKGLFDAHSDWQSAPTSSTPTDQGTITQKLMGNANTASSNSRNAIGGFNAAVQGSTNSANAANRVGNQRNAAWTQQLSNLSSQQNPYSPNSAGFQGYLNQQQQQVNQHFAGAPQALDASLAARGLMGSGQQGSGESALGLQQASAYDQATNSAYTNLYNNAAGWQNTHNQQMDSLLNANGGTGDYSAAGQMLNGQLYPQGMLANGQMGESNSAYGATNGMNGQYWNGIGGSVGNAINAGLAYGNSPGAQNLAGQAWNGAQSLYNNVTGGGQSAPSSGTNYSGDTYGVASVNPYASNGGYSPGGVRDLTNQYNTSGSGAGLTASLQQQYQQHQGQQQAQPYYSPGFTDAAKSAFANPVAPSYGSASSGGYSPHPSGGYSVQSLAPQGQQQPFLHQQINGGANNNPSFG